MGSCSDCIEIALCFFLFLQSGTSVVSDGQLPKFDVPIWNVTAVAGSTAVLPCSVSGISTDKFKVGWSDSSSKLLTVGDKRIITDTRMSVERPFTKAWHLHIRKVGLNDSGTYHCHVNTKPPKDTKVLLTVHEPPYIKDHAGDQVVKEGSTVSLWCKVSGTPYPSVTWYRHYIYDKDSRREVIGEEGEALNIHNISRHCEDVYECVATNSVNSSSQKMNVTVEFAPEVELYSHKMAQEQGKETMLACRITANPFTYVVWKRKDREINNSHKYGIRVFNDDRHTKTMNLRIGHVSEKDFGKYKCYAHNILGEDSEEMTLYELKVRKPTTSSTFNPLIIDTKTLRYPQRTDTYHNPGNRWENYPTQSWTPVHIAGNTRASRGGSARIYNHHVTICIIFCSLYLHRLLRKALS